ncbi:acetate/propionate family kinase [Sphingobium lactosutens]|uniref:Acetate kinase n=1 Tax=Sphingobium lactosutens DS20 TaxID=1331060 RepID=T0IJ15_9SPHN|nr:acetate/propionate family kinase [Sphingobium lactosutens]EQB11720.1 hypothetical protein RLDS_21555 [Sphingobium lactosutens DS20]
MTILSLNAGSSSIKFALFSMTEGEPLRLGHGKIEEIGIAPSLVVWGADEAVTLEHRWEHTALTHEELLGDLLEALENRLGSGLEAVGHRIVHGGEQFSAPVRIDEGVLSILSSLSPLAPLHQPHNLAAVRAVARHRPSLPQVACFDTAFHHGQPHVASRVAVPRKLGEQGVRRYGFHGISYAYIARRLAELDPVTSTGRVIVAHLGNGASLCAMNGGRSIESTMGFTALDGLVMGTRCGSIDPGILIYLMQQGMSLGAVEHMLYSESGLLGLSGVSSDMRTLLASHDLAAAEAVELFVYRIVTQAGALAASLAGLDAFVFTGGIGENAAQIREQVATGLHWLGAGLDPSANERGDFLISTPESRIKLMVLPTDEERMIAIDTQAILRAKRS